MEYKKNGLVSQWNLDRKICGVMPMEKGSFVWNRSLSSGFRPATEWRNSCHYPARLGNPDLFCFCHAESARGRETYCFIRDLSRPFEGTKEIYILSFPCYFATWPSARVTFRLCAGLRLLLFHTLYSSLLYILLVVPFKFKKLFVLCGNDVIKTILRNVDVGNVIFPPVQKMGQDHSVDGLMADDHNIIRALV